MKIAHLSVSPQGGAGHAATKLIKCLNANPQLKNHGYCWQPTQDNALWTSIQHKHFQPSDNFLRLFKSLARKGGLASPEPISPSWMGRIHRLPSLLDDADILHFHHIGENFLNLDRLTKRLGGRPIIWTLHDLHGICGVSHYLANNGQRYSKDDELKWFNSSTRNLAVNWALSCKKEFLLKNKVTFVTLSQWQYEIISNSPLAEFAQDIQLIPLPIEAASPLALSRAEAKIKLGLEPTKPLIISGAADAANPRKGAAILQEAIRNSPYSWLIFGDQNSLYSRFSNVTSLPFINDPQDLRNIYTAGDLFVLPSLEDNSPQTGIEALQCGSPVICFQSNGASDYVQSLSPELVVRQISAEALNQCIETTLTTCEELQVHELFEAYRKKTHEPSHCIQRYFGLYQKTISS